MTPPSPPSKGPDDRTSRVILSIDCSPAEREQVLRILQHARAALKADLGHDGRLLVDYEDGESGEAGASVRPTTSSSMPLDRFQESSPVSVSNRGGRIDTSTDQAVTKREAAEEGDSFPAAAAPVRNVRSRTTDGLFNPAQAARPAHSIHVTTSTATPTLNSVSAETAPADEDGSIQPDALPVAPYAVGGFASPPAVMLQLSAAHKHIALESRRYQAPSCPLKFTRVVDLLRSHGSDFRVNVRGYFSFFPASDLGAITNGKIWKLMLYAVPESGEGKAPGIPLLMSVPDNVPLSTLFPDLALDRPPEVVQLDVVILNAVLIGWHGRSDRWLIVDSQTSIFSNPSVLWRRGT